MSSNTIAAQTFWGEGHAYSRRSPTLIAIVVHHTHGCSCPRRSLWLGNYADTDTISVSFSLCGDSARVTCVVDGDTFWLDAVKYRISDIDTPEISESGCQEELTLGEAAKFRLLSLLNEGPFGLKAGLRDEDKYGRKLRAVYRGGLSLGDVLVEEGLARTWKGQRMPWCGQHHSTP